MRERMKALGEEYDVTDPTEKMEATKKASDKKRRKAKIKKQKDKSPFSAFGLAKKIKKRGKQLKKSIQE